MGRRPMVATRARAFGVASMIWPSDCTSFCQLASNAARSIRAATSKSLRRRRRAPMFDEGNSGRWMGSVGGSSSSSSARRSATAKPCSMNTSAAAGNKAPVRIDVISGDHSNAWSTHWSIASCVGTMLTSSKMRCAMVGSCGHGRMSIRARVCSAFLTGENVRDAVAEKEPAEPTIRSTREPPVRPGRSSNTLTA